MPRGRKPREERRRSDRYPLKVPVDYSAVDAFFTEFSSNINEGGIFIEADECAPIGSVIQLQFRLPGLARPISVDGIVTWVSDGKSESPSGMGVEFHELPADARETINAIVRRLRAHD